MTERSDLLTVAEAAAVVQVHPGWLHARIARDELPAVLVDGKRHVRVVDLDAWIEAQRIVPRADRTRTDPACQLAQRADCAAVSYDTNTDTCRDTIKG